MPVTIKKQLRMVVTQCNWSALSYIALAACSHCQMLDANPTAPLRLLPLQSQRRGALKPHQIGHRRRQSLQQLWITVAGCTLRCRLVTYNRVTCRDLLVAYVQREQMTYIPATSSAVIVCSRSDYVRLLCLLGSMGVSISITTDCCT
jgi:hypothetical protein